MARRGNAGTGRPPEETAAASQVMGASNSIDPADRGNGSAAQENRPSGGREGITFSSDEIAQRAYQIYERDGHADGRDMDHWLQAERELREERERAGRTATQQSQQNRPAGDQNRDQARAQQDRGGSANRPARPDEAPRSARRHQAPMV